MPSGLSASNTEPLGTRTECGRHRRENGGWASSPGCCPRAHACCSRSSAQGQLCGQKRRHAQHPQGCPCDCFCLPLAPTAFPALAKCPQLEGAGSRFLRVDPVSRKSVKPAHSTRNRYSSQWTLTKCQASTPARTLTSDWRTVGSQHGVTVTESDSYSASLSQDTGETRVLPVSCSLSSSTPIIQLHLPFPQLLPSSPWGHAQVSLISS